MADRYIPEHRRTQFKAKSTFKPEELRRRREEQQVEIRKAKREENLAKRRGIGTGENRPGASLGAAPDSDDDTAPTESQVRKFSVLLICSIFSSMRMFSLRNSQGLLGLPLFLACLAHQATDDAWASWITLLPPQYILASLSKPAHHPALTAHAISFYSDGYANMIVSV